MKFIHHLFRQQADQPIIRKGEGREDIYDDCKHFSGKLDGYNHTLLLNVKLFIYIQSISGNLKAYLTMNTILIILQVFVGLNILRIWLVTNQRESIYRGGEGKAKTLRGEFEYYGLPIWFMYTVGALKVAMASGLILGIWMPQFIPFAAGGLIVLMIGAVAMHFKVRDNLQTYLPALLMLTLSSLIFYLSW